MSQNQILEERIKYLERRLSQGSDRQSIHDSFFDNSPDYCYVISPNGIILDINPSALEALGYERDELIGAKITSIHPSSSHEKAERIFNKWKSTGQLKDEEIEIVTKSGQKRTVLLNSGAVRDDDGNILYSTSTQRDITESKEIKERCRGIFDRTTSAIAIYRAVDGGDDFEFIDLNPAALAAEKLSIDEIVGRRVTEAFPNIREFGLLDVFREVYKTGIASELPESFYKDGRIEGWRYNLVFKLSNDDIVCIYDDISEKKAVIQELSAFEARLSSILKNSPAVSYQFKMSSDGTFSFPFISQNIKQIIGVESEEVMYDVNNLLGKIEPGYVEKFRNHVLGSAKDLTLYEDVVPAIIDGDLVWMEVKSVPKKLDDGSILWDGFMQNVTDRINYESQLQDTSEKLELALKASNVGLWDWDLRSNAVYFSKEWKQQIGYEENEFEDRYDEWEKRIHPDDIETVKSAVNEYLGGKREDYVVEFRLQHKDGSYRWIESEGEAVRDEKGFPVRFLGSHRDVTEKKSLEDELKQAHKMEAMGTMAGGIAHDFNNILTPIIGFAELGIEETASEGKLYDHFMEIHNSAKRAKGLVQQILAFSRQSDVEKKPLKLNNVITEVSQLIRASIPTTINIEQELEGNCYISGNPNQIHQILMNLITNAQHAMEDEGGTLEIKLKKTELSPSKVENNGLNHGKYVVLSVTDSGTGIPLHIINRIFDPYFTTKKGDKGTGLGLSVVHGIVRDHGGLIEVDSVLGRGTKFDVYLPTLETHVSNNPSPTGQIYKGNQSILYVDDEQSITKLGKLTLERYGYTVTTRNSSTDALELFRNNPQRFDLVITDLTMPNMTGIELAGQIKNLRHETGVILCTGFSEKMDDNQAASYGIDRVVLKPLARNDMLKTVYEVLEKYKK
ncbi:PAS domain S-box protein [Candidatus Woesearchaeota archaeon]|nr:PAS domain S-box protein [Candidatus Woesearchaeota archaeon]